MKKTLLNIFVCIATMQTASAMTWQSPSQECSLTFPNTEWTLRKGEAMPRGQILLEALNREQTKSVTVLSFQAPPSASVQDPGFAENVKKGFASTGSHPLNDGYTNLNGRIAYWLTGTKNLAGRQTSTISYSLRAGNFLYQLHLESLNTNPACDEELIAITRSFLVSDKNSSKTDSFAYHIGIATGLLIVLAVVLYRRQGNNRGSTTPSAGVDVRRMP